MHKNIQLFSYYERVWATGGIVRLHIFAQWLLRVGTRLYWNCVYPIYCTTRVSYVPLPFVTQTRGHIRSECSSPRRTYSACLCFFCGKFGNRMYGLPIYIYIYMIIQQYVVESLLIGASCGQLLHRNKISKGDSNSKNWSLLVWHWGREVCKISLYALFGNTNILRFVYNDNRSMPPEPATNEMLFFFAFNCSIESFDIVSVVAENKYYFAVVWFVFILYPIYLVNVSLLQCYRCQYI